MQGLTSKHRLLHFIKARILKMMAEVKYLDKSLFESEGNISSSLLASSLLNRLLSTAGSLTKAEWLTHRWINFFVGFLTDNSGSIGSEKLGGTEWLKLILNDVEPYHFHLYLWKVGELPEHNLMAHVHGHEDI